MKFDRYFCCLLSLIFFQCVKLTTSAATSGPYKTTLVRVSKCETTFPLEKDPPLVTFLEVYNTGSKNYMRGNITVLRENKEVKMKLKSYVWRNGQWKPAYLLNNFGCHSVLLYLALRAFGMKYNRETCGFAKGSYYFKDIELNTLQHILSSKMEYGRILWKSETTTMSTSYDCWEFETLTEPLE